MEGITGIIPQKSPIIFILGPTGIGKTKVSLDLAKNLEAEIINSDAFNIYKEANIMIAKATKEEREAVRHHMIDIVELNEINYKVLNYSNDSRDVISDIVSREKTPLVVGGTNYYVEAILIQKIQDEKGETDLNEEDLYEGVFSKKSDFSFVTEELKSCVSDIKMILKSTEITDRDRSHSKLKNYLEKLDVLLVHKLLHLVDPHYATFLHKNDTRRIINGIIYFFLNGRQKSEKFCHESIRLTYPNSFIVLLNPSSFQRLQIRIEKRVEEMLSEKSGGLLEIFSTLNYFQILHGKYNLEKSFTEGVLQAIGYKEFYPLFKFSDPNCDVLDHNYIDKLIETNKSIYEDCLNKLKSNTVKYAKKQYKFIKKRIVPYIKKENLVEINIEEFTNEKFSEYINIAETRIRHHLKTIKKEVNSNSDLNETNEILQVQEKLNKLKFSNWKKYFCDVCNVEANGDEEFKNHKKSKRHKKSKSSKNKYILPVITNQ